MLSFHILCMLLDFYYPMLHYAYLFFDKIIHSQANYHRHVYIFFHMNFLLISSHQGAAIDRILGEIVHRKRITTPIDYVLCIGHFLSKVRLNVLM
jgi:hypothetical protein